MWRLEFEYRRSHTDWDFLFLLTHTKKKCPTSGELLIRGYIKLDFTVDEGKERLTPLLAKKARQALQKEDGEILCGLPPLWPRQVFPKG